MLYDFSPRFQQEFDDTVDEEYLVESEVAEEEQDVNGEDFMDDEEEGGMV